MEAYSRLLAVFLACAIAAATGCQRPSVETVAEGVLYSVEYQLEGGRTGGFTRLNNSKAVPGGNGSWNIDAYGRLTPDFLIITRPQHRGLGPQIIPVHRLVNVQFGDGGIAQVDESAGSVQPLSE